MNKNEFIDLIKEGALKGKTDFNILPSVTIAQAILESGWGSSQLSKRANNLFGIKAFSDWQGKRITLPTTEWYNDQLQIIDADFRAYDNFNESIEDHNKLISYIRYGPVRGCLDYRTACRKLYECSYATDPNYPEKLIQIIEENRLFDYDTSLSMDILSRGSQNEKILKFQRLCNILDIRDSEDNKLVEDNVLGWRTESCIHKMPQLAVGSTGPAVELVQEVVGVPNKDGIFGPITRQCVISYQLENNLDADGIVGFRTWNSIIS